MISTRTVLEMVVTGAQANTFAVVDAAVQQALPSQYTSERSRSLPLISCWHSNQMVASGYLGT